MEFKLARVDRDELRGRERDTNRGEMEEDKMKKEEGGGGRGDIDDDDNDDVTVFKDD